uniref:Zinc finger protein 318 n=1 Tax=Seriola lalandi dorsalis TaxID=1841481 RepID=A0A3B4YIV9_SERLL
MDRSRAKSRGRSKSRPRSQSRSPDRSRAKSRGRSKSRSLDRSRAKSRGRSKSRSPDRSRAKSRGRSKSRSPDRSRAKSRGRSKSRARSKSRPRSRSRSKSRSRSRSRSRGRSRGRSFSKVASHARSKSRQRSRSASSSSSSSSGNDSDEKSRKEFKELKMARRRKELEEMLSLPTKSILKKRNDSEDSPSLRVRRKIHSLLLPQPANNKSMRHSSLFLCAVFQSIDSPRALEGSNFSHVADQLLLAVKGMEPHAVASMLSELRSDPQMANRAGLDAEIKEILNLLGEAGSGHKAQTTKAMDDIDDEEKFLYGDSEEPKPPPASEPVLYGDYPPPKAITVQVPNPEYEKIQDLLKTIGLDLGVAEITKMAARTKERLHGNKPPPKTPTRCRRYSSGSSDGSRGRRSSDDSCNKSAPPKSHKDRDVKETKVERSDATPPLHKEPPPHLPPQTPNPNNLPPHPGVPIPTYPPAQVHGMMTDEFPPTLPEKLKQEREIRMKKKEYLMKELERLRKQQGELLRKKRREKGGHKDPLLQEISHLQEEVMTQISNLRKEHEAAEKKRNEIDKVALILGLSPSDRPRRASKPAEDQEKSMFDHSSKNHESVHSVNVGNDKIVGSSSPVKPPVSAPPPTPPPEPFEYYDAGNHWCKNCNVTSGSMFDFFTHLHSKTHRKTLDPYDRPWASTPTKIIKNMLPEEKLTKPAKGSEFLLPVRGFFCLLCKEFYGDAICAEEHVTTHAHNEKYKKQMYENPLYEQRRNLDRQAGLSSETSGKKRKHEDDEKGSKDKDEKSKHKKEKKDKEKKKEDDDASQKEEKSKVKKEDGEERLNPAMRAKLRKQSLEAGKPVPALPTTSFGKFTWKKKENMLAKVAEKVAAEFIKEDEAAASQQQPVSVEDSFAKSMAVAKEIAHKLGGQHNMPPSPWVSNGANRGRIRPNLPAPAAVLRKTTMMGKPAPLNTFLSIRPQNTSLISPTLSDGLTKALNAQNALLETKPVPPVGGPEPCEAMPTPAVSRPGPSEAKPPPLASIPAPFEVKPSPPMSRPEPFEAKPPPPVSRLAPFEVKPAPPVSRPEPFQAKPPPPVSRLAPIDVKPAPPVSKPASDEVKPIPSEAKPAASEGKPPPSVAKPTQPAMIKIVSDVAAPGVPESEQTRTVFVKPPPFMNMSEGAQKSEKLKSNLAAAKAQELFGIFYSSTSQSGSSSITKPATDSSSSSNKSTPPAPQAPKPQLHPPVQTQSQSQPPTQVHTAPQPQPQPQPDSKSPPSTPQSHSEIQIASVWSMQSTPAPTPETTSQTVQPKLTPQAQSAVQSETQNQSSTSKSESHITPQTEPEPTPETQCQPKLPLQIQTEPQSKPQPDQGTQSHLDPAPEPEPKPGPKTRGKTTPTKKASPAARPVRQTRSQTRYQTRRQQQQQQNQSEPESDMTSGDSESAASDPKGLDTSDPGSGSLQEEGGSQEMEITPETLGLPPDMTSLDFEYDFNFE